MRSSKSRSRSKSNRQRSLGNIVNRVFDSSGPEGKVRGTPQQIIDKYLMLARDAQLSNDRVAEQNFLQHAEHYTRMLNEALREMNREHELRQGQPGEAGQNGAQIQGGQSIGQPNGPANGGQQGQNFQPNGDRQQPHRPRHDDRIERETAEPRPTSVEDEADEGPGLVDTPEARMDQRRPETMMPDPAERDAPQPQAAGATESPAQPKKSRGPRKPRDNRAGSDAKESSADAAE
ncbi:MAG: DUF4167 domain-containing protein [Albidovulum sp.]